MLKNQVENISLQTNNPQVVLKFARECGIDYVFVSADKPLANGVVDVLLENNFKAIGGTKMATRLEWDKIYSIKMMDKLSPQFTPFFRVASKIDELQNIISEFKSIFICKLL